MIGRKGNFYITVFICVLGLFLSACNKGVNTAKEEKSVDLSNHYNEEKIVLPEGVVNISDVIVLNTGALRIAGTDTEGYNGTIWDSNDNGETWTKVINYTEILAIDDTATSVAYLSSTGEIAVTINKIASADHDDDDHDEDGDDDMHYYVLNAAGDFRELTNVSAKIRAILFTKAGSLLGIGANKFDFRQQIYALDDKTGEIIKAYYSEDDGVSAFTTSSRQIYMLLNTSEASTVDLTTGKDAKNGKELKNIASDLNLDTLDRPTKIDLNTAKKDDSADFYVASGNGIYYYSGSKIERLVDAERTFLGIWWIDKFVAANKKNLFVVANNGEGEQSLLHYRYQDEGINHASEELTVYTLIENEPLRKEIILYQRQNPEIEINLEVGVSGGAFVENGTATTDAIKKLNTEILAGNGPDIIFFDGISVDNYINQELLVDLTKTVRLVAEEQAFLDNILQTYTRENKLFAIPTRFATMMVVGDSQAAEAGKELTALVQQMHTLHETDSAKDVFESWAIKQMASIFYRTHLSAKITDEGALSKKDIESFYSLLKKVDELRSREKDDEGDPSKVTVNKNYIKDQTLSFITNVYEGKAQMAIDYISSATAYRDVIIAKNKKGLASSLMEAGAGNFYVPQMTVGINAKSKKIAASQLFVQFLLTKDIQLENQYYGFPINKQALQESLQNPADMGDELSGNLEEHEQLEALELLASLDTPANTDSILMEIVMNEAENHLRGKKDLQKAADDAMKKVKLYLAE